MAPRSSTSGVPFRYEKQPDVYKRQLLWRLDHYGIELPKNAAPLQKYAERIFSRPAYIEALTPSEKVMRR